MAMTVGVARVALYLEDTFSLKDKRQTVRSITNKVRNQFNAGIAEVADLNDPRVATAQPSASRYMTPRLPSALSVTRTSASATSSGAPG